MKVYLINLDRDRERLAVADRQLKALGVGYERVPAVYGKSLTAEEKKNAVSYFRWWCLAAIPPRDGEIGCALSHLSAYRKIVQVGDVACVLEDDVILDNRFKDVLDRVEKWVDPSRPQVVLLSNHSVKSKCGDATSGYFSLQERQFEVVSSSGDWCTEGYVITAAAAKSLLWQNTPLKIAADAWTRWSRIGAIDLYHAFPTVCRQNKAEFDSYCILKDSQYDVAKMSVPRWIWHKIKRLIGNVIDMCFVMITGR